MSKLTIIRNALETNPEVIIVKAKEKNYLPDREGFFSHTIDFIIAPVNGLYTADELQDFMMGLVPDLKPTRKDDFRKYEDTLDFGKLYFDEKIGKERNITKRILTLTDEDLFNIKGFVDGKRTIDIDETLDYRRRVWIRPYPNEAVAMDILNRKLDSFDINLEDLKRYQPKQPNLMQRILSRK